MVVGNGKPGVGRAVGRAGGRAVPKRRIAPGVVRGRIAEREAVPENVDAIAADYQFAFGMRVLFARMASYPVIVATDSQDKRAQDLAANLTTRWSDALSWIARAFRNGRSAFEIVWRYDPAQRIVVVDELIYLEPGVSSQHLGASGEFAGVYVYGDEPDAPDEEREKALLPIGKAWWCAVDATATNPHGTSRLCGAPEKTFTVRDGLFWLRDEANSRFGLGIAKARGLPERIDGENEPYDNLEAMKSAYMAARSGGVIALNGERDEQGNYVDDIELLTDGTDAAPIDATIDGTDAEALRALGIPEKTVTEGSEVGSFAMVSEQTRVILSVVEELLSQFTASFDRHVVRFAVARNFGDGPDAPTFRIDFPRLSSRPDGLVVDVAKAIVSAPAVSPILQLIDVGRVLELSGLPLRQDNRDRANEIVDAAVAAAGAATAGNPLADLIAPGAEPPVGGPNGPRNEGGGTDGAAGGDGTGGPNGPPNRPTGEPPERVAASQILASRAGNRAGFPTFDEVAERTSELVREAYAAFRERLAKVHASGGPRDGRAIRVAVRELLERLRDLGGAARVATRILGRLSPWIPTLQSVPEGQPTGDAAEPPDANRFRAGPKMRLSMFGRSLGTMRVVPWFGVRTAPARGGRKAATAPGLLTPDVAYPFIEDGLAWLQGRNLLTPAEFGALSADAKRGSFSVPGAADIGQVQAIATAIQEGFVVGESRESFIDRTSAMMAQAGATEAQAETLFRTETHRAYLEGFDKTMENPDVRAELGYVMVGATDDNRTRPEHSELDGVVVAVGTGAYDVVRRALADYNCILPGETIRGDLVCAVKSFYSGQAVEIVLESGDKLRVTKQHPVLTPDGLVPAGKIESGTQLFLNVGCVEEGGHGFAVDTFRAGASQEDQMPSRVEDVFRAMSAIGATERARTQAGDFHGEAEFFHGDVDVVWTDRKLLRNAQVAGTKEVGDIVFKAPLPGAVGGFDLPQSVAVGEAGPLESFRFGSPANADAGGHEAANNQSAVDPERDGQSLDRLASEVPGGQGVNVDVGTKTWAGRDVLRRQPSPDSRDPNPESAGDFRSANPGQVQLSRVVSVRHFHYSGEVYDFQSTTGLIVVSNVTIGNCRCALIPLSYDEARQRGITTKASGLPLSVRLKYA